MSIDSKILSLIKMSSIAIWEVDTVTLTVTSLHTTEAFPEYNNTPINGIPEFEQMRTIFEYISNTKDHSLSGINLPIKTKDSMCMVNLMVPDSTKDSLLILVQPMPSYSSKLYEAQRTIGDRYNNLSYVNLLTDEETVITRPNFIPFTGTNPLSGSFSNTLNHALKQNVFPDDCDVIRRFLDRDYLTNEFISGKKEVSFYYRRKNGVVYNWHRSIIVPTNDFTPDNPTVLIMDVDYYSDTLIVSALNNTINQNAADDRNPSDLVRNLDLELLDIVRSQTEAFDSFFSIDLENDTFSSFKYPSHLHNIDRQERQSFSRVSTEIITNNVSEPERSILLNFISLDNLKSQLKLRHRLDHRFKDCTGLPKTMSILLIATENGRPKKALCTVAVNNSGYEFLTVKTFGTFQVLGKDLKPVHFEKKQSKEVLAYLIDKHGYPVVINDIITYILERDISDLNAKKYASALIRKGIRDLEAAGYPNVIICENHSYRINENAVDCDLYHFLKGDFYYWSQYNNEYMKEYSWSEETNAELMDTYADL